MNPSTNNNNHLETVKGIAQWGKDNGKSEKEIMAAVLKYQNSVQPQMNKGGEPPVSNSWAAQAGRAATSPIKENWADVKETGQRIKGHVDNAVDARQGIQSDFEAGEMNRAQMSVAKTGSMFKHVGKMAVDTAIGAGKAVLPQFAEDAITGTIDAAKNTDVYKATADEMGRYTEDFMKKESTQRAVEQFYSLPTGQQAALKGVVEGLEGMADIATVGTTGVIANEFRAAATRGIRQQLEKRLAEVEPTDTGAVKATFWSGITQLRHVDPEVNKAAQNYAKHISEAFLQSNRPTNVNLKELANARGMTLQEMIDDWATRGYMPQPKDNGAADFEQEFFNLKAQRDEIWNKEIAPKVTAIKDEFDADILEQNLKSASVGDYLDDYNIKPTRPADYDKVQAKITKLIDNYKQAWDTDTFTAEQLRKIQSDMNQVLNAQNLEGWEISTEELVATYIRRTFDDLDPSIGEANKKYGQLLQDEKIMRMFDEQTIELGYLENALSRLGSVILGGSLLSAGGISVSSGAGLVGGGLIISGAIATLGAKAFANYIRHKRFNPARKQEILDALKADPAATQQLLNSASPEDAALIKSELQIGDTE